MWPCGNVRLDTSEGFDFSRKEWPNKVPKMSPILGPGEIALPEECLPHMPEDPRLIPNTHIKSLGQWPMPVVQEPRRQRLADSNRTDQPQVPVRDPITKNN